MLAYFQSVFTLRIKLLIMDIKIALAALVLRTLKGMEKILRLVVRVSK